LTVSATPQLVIVADDLTGAADTGAAFADAGLATAIPLAGAPPPAADVLVLSTESRDLAADAAIKAASAAAAGVLSVAGDAGPRWIYKKIDSALRGHPRDELLAVMAAAGATRAVVAPAFPAEGRTTIGGRQWVDGAPLEASRFRQTTAGSDLIALFQNDRGIPVRHLDKATIRADPKRLRQILAAASPGITIADAENDADLAALAAAVSRGPLRILCGAAGFARQLARALPLRTETLAPTAVAPAAGPILVVAGSQHEATARQIEAMRRAGAAIVTPPQRLLDDSSLKVDITVSVVADHLAAGRDTVLTTAGLSPSRLGQDAVVARLAQIATASLVRRRVGGLVLTGGDVAVGVCAALSASTLWLRGEIAPGLPWGVLAGGVLPGLSIATKAGSFGDDAALLACVDDLAHGSRAAGDGAG
jgi:4-hydroxythreonine-4-phosphate dehydrogenase